MGEPLKRSVRCSRLIWSIKKISLLIFGIVFCSLNLSAQTKLTPEEYTVYASVLKVIYKENRNTYSNKSEFVIIDETKVYPDADLPLKRRYRNLVATFKEKNSISAAAVRASPRIRHIFATQKRCWHQVPSPVKTPLASTLKARAANSHHMDPPDVMFLHCPRP